MSKYKHPGQFYVPLVCYKRPLLLPRAACVLQITHSVGYFAKTKQNKSILKCIYEVLQAAVLKSDLIISKGTLATKPEWNSVEGYGVAQSTEGSLNP